MAKMTKEEKENIARGISGTRLMELFLSYLDDFNPIDYDRCETYNVIKAEIIRRCEK